MTKVSYNDSVDIKNLEKCEKILRELPLFVTIYFDAKKEKMSSKTLLGYMYDFSKFFSWASSYMFDDRKPYEISLEEFEKIEEYDLNKYILFLQTDTDSYNSNITIRRKISSLSSLFSYLYKGGYVNVNPCKYIEYPDFIVKENEYLSKDQIDMLIDKIKNEKDDYSDKQITYIDKTRNRDFAIFYLLLTTGIRVTECIALNIDSIDFKNKVLNVDREVVIKLPISDKTIEMLKEYLKYRKTIESDDDALFLSMQNKRLCVQAVEDMIRKHGDCLSLFYSLTPKVFRYTFAMEMFKVSANADLVNSYLGKKKVEDIRILMNSLTKEQKKSVYDTLNKMYN